MIKEKIDNLLKEGKSTNDIIDTIVTYDEAAEKSADDLMKIINESKNSMKKTFELEAKKRDLKESMAKVSLMADVADQISLGKKELKKEFDDSLKKINIMMPKFQDSYKSGTKLWCPTKKKMIPVEECLTFNPIVKKFQDGLIAAARKDFTSAKAIDKEIMEEELKQYGVKSTIESETEDAGAVTIPTIVASEIRQLTFIQSIVLQQMKTDPVIVQDKIYPTLGLFQLTAIDTQDTALTETPVNDQFANNTVDMKRVGAFTIISNTILDQNVNIMPAVMTGYASSRAKYIDLIGLTGNTEDAGATVERDPFDGLVFQALEAGYVESSPVSINSLTIENLTTLIEEINQDINFENTIWIGPRTVYHKIGLFENQGGREFPNFVQNGQISPFGMPFVLSTKMATTLDFAGDSRLAGGESALILVDTSNFIFAMSGGMKMDVSDHVKFLSDQKVLRGVERMAAILLKYRVSGGGFDTAGTVRVLKITNA